LAGEEIDVHEMFMKSGEMRSRDGKEVSVL
jgi:hypothetical protein